MMPSEVMTQMLFYTYAHVFATSLSKKLVMFSPTQSEEERLAYDVRLSFSCRELYLQFKRVEQISPSNLKFKVDNNKSKNLEKCQLDELKARYPDRSAYYVAGGFSNVQCALHAQNKYLDAKNFLDIYAAVSAHSVNLRKKSTYIKLNNFCGVCNHKSYSPEIYKNLLTHRQDWLYGSELIKEFLQGSGASVGCSVNVRGDKIIRMPNSIAREQNAQQIEVSIDEKVGYKQGFMILRVFDR